MQAIPLLKDSIKKAYGKKGDKIVNMNYAAVDKALEHLVKIDIPEGWGKGEVGGPSAAASFACLASSAGIRMCGFHVSMSVQFTVAGLCIGPSFALGCPT